MRHTFQNRIPRILTLLLLISLSLDFEAQNISYYDKDWNIATIDKAKYFFVTIDNFPRYRVSDIFGNDKNLDKRQQRISRKIDKKIDYNKLFEIDFSDSHYDSIYIGKKVKIFADGEYYDYLCCSSDSSIDWPSNEIKSQSGICSKNWQAPKNGDFGIVVWQFRDFKGSSGETVFVIELNDCYISIPGKSLTMVDKFSKNEIDILKMKQQPKRFLKRRISTEQKYKKF